ncbi:MAG: hypothetical protein WBQ78_16680 [Gammaproteobacteria bacterium]
MFDKHDIVLIEGRKLPYRPYKGLINWGDDYPDYFRVNGIEYFFGNLRNNVSDPFILTYRNTHTSGARAAASGSAGIPRGAPVATEVPATGLRTSSMEMTQVLVPSCKKRPENMNNYRIRIQPR